MWIMFILDFIIRHVQCNLQEIIQLVLFHPYQTGHFPLKQTQVVVGNGALKQLVVLLMAEILHHLGV